MVRKNRLINENSTRAITTLLLLISFVGRNIWRHLTISHTTWFMNENCTNLIMFVFTLNTLVYMSIIHCRTYSLYVYKSMRNKRLYIHTVFALLCFVVVIHWLIFPYPSGLLHWHCGNLTIAPVPAKPPWWIWINTSCEFIMNDCITTTKQSTTKPCAYFLGYTVYRRLFQGPWQSPLKPKFDHSELGLISF